MLSGPDKDADRVTIEQATIVPPSPGSESPQVLSSEVSAVAKDSGSAQRPADEAGIEAVLEVPAIPPTSIQSTVQAKGDIAVAKQRARNRDALVPTAKEGGAKVPGRTRRQPRDLSAKPAENARLVRPGSMARPAVDQEAERAIQQAKKQNRRIVFGTLFLFVLLPTFLAGLYYFFVASDQYVAEAKFAIRGEHAPTSDLIGFLGGTTSGVETGDSYILQEYITSKPMVEKLDKDIGVRDLYDRPEADFLARMTRKVPIEDFLTYWKSMIKMEFDQQTGIISLQARAFTAADSLLIAKRVVEEGTNLVNGLSDRARDDAVSLSRAELKNAEDRLAKARLALANFRGDTNTLDPAEKVKSFETRIADLQMKISDSEAKLNSLKGFVSETSPSYRILKSNVDGLKTQLVEEQAKISQLTPSDGTYNAGLSTQMNDYQALNIEAEFSQKFYVNAMEALLRANLEAKRKTKYLAIFVEPTLAEEATYPLRSTNTLMVFIGSFFAWAIGALLYAAIKDHVV